VLVEVSTNVIKTSSVAPPLSATAIDVNHEAVVIFVWSGPEHSAPRVPGSEASTSTYRNSTLSAVLSPQVTHIFF